MVIFGFCRRSHHADEYPATTASYQPLLFNEPFENEDFLQMERLSTRVANNNTTHRFENTIEAKVEPGDTLQAIALRFHCTVADIKRLNKIDKDNEIHARKVVKIPVTIHNVLLDNLPAVHKSGNNSPRQGQKTGDNGSRDSVNGLNSIVRNPLEDAEAMLSEKLMVASVNSSGPEQPSTSKEAAQRHDQINNIILNSKLKPGSVNVYTDDGK